MPHDVACDDVKMDMKGWSAAQCLASCRRYRRRNPSGLSGVDICTALYPEVWNIYSPMGDAVYSKPYRLHWGENPAVFMEEEISVLVQAVRSASPRPVIWVPERFRAARALTGEEYEQLAWSAFMVGARTLRNHQWKNDVKNPFRENSSLERSVVEFNNDFSRVRARLDLLVPVRTWTDRDSRVKICEGWCSSRGILLFVRNLAYGDAIGKDRSVVFEYDIPQWMEAEDITDAFSGNKVDATNRGGRLTIKLSRLVFYRLIWISNAKMQTKGEK